jgi:hypothetical protein
MGKTTEVLKALAPLIENGARVHYYVPEHRLGAEIAETFAKFSTHRPRIWRGRGRPELTPDGAPMCVPDMHEKAAVLDAAKVSVAKHLCPTCPHLGECGWSRQAEDTGPGLVVAPINYAFDKSAKRADIQVFDETFFKAAITGVMINLGGLGAMDLPVPSRNKSDQRDWAATAVIDKARKRLEEAFVAAKGVWIRSCRAACRTAISPT